MNATIWGLWHTEAGRWVRVLEDLDLCSDDREERVTIAFFNQGDAETAAAWHLAHHDMTCEVRAMGTRTEPAA